MFKKKTPPRVITTLDLAQLISTENVIPVPLYSEKKESELIVIPRGTIYDQKVKNKKTIKL